MGDWVEWRGSPTEIVGPVKMPELPRGTFVDVKFRDGGFSISPTSFEEWGINWNHDTWDGYDDSDAIVAYRIAD